MHNLQNTVLYIKHFKQYCYIIALEEDITMGIFQTKDPRRHCLCYRREVQNVQDYLNGPGVSQFFEVKEVSLVFNY